MVYKFEFKMPSVLQATGLKLVTQAQIDFMLKLFNRDESITGIISNGCHPSLSWYIGGGYAIAKLHVDDDIPVNRFINYSYEASPPESLQTYKKLGGVESLVEFLEVTYQLHENLAVWCSTDEDELGYEPEWDGDYHYLIPLTLERIKRLRQPFRRKQLEEVIGVGYGYDYHFKYRFKLSDKEAQDIWYGESGFRLNTMLSAEKGDESAITAWAAIK